MKHNNIKIIATEIFYPEREIKGEEFLSKFDKDGVDIRGLTASLGRYNVRRLIENEETVISMGAKVGKKALKSSGLKPEDIDMLIFTTDNPEFFAPSNALILHNQLGLKNAQITFDLNNNCISMITAMEVVSKIMKSRNEVNRAMIIGTQKVNSSLKNDDVVMYPGSGDGSACIILQKEYSEKESGIIDSIFYTNSALEHNMRLPACGVSNIFSGKAKTEDMKMMFKPHDVSFFSRDWANLITELLKRNNLNVNNVSHYLFSQFSLSDIKDTVTKLNDEPHKYTFISDKYGYMGCGSPIFALHEAIEENRINKNSYIIFCSVGIGYSMVALLYKV